MQCLAGRARTAVWRTSQACVASALLHVPLASREVKSPIFERDNAGEFSAFSCQRYLVNFQRFLVKQ